MQISRRSVLLGGVGLTGAVLTGSSLSGCSAGGSEGAITVYSSEEAIDALAERFMDDNPDYTVDVVRGGSGELLARAVAEKDSPQCDVWWAGGGSEENDLWDELPSGATDSIDPQFRSDGPYAATMQVLGTMFIYNTGLLEDGETIPETWEGLGDPQWKGRIYFTDPSASNAAYTALVNWVQAGGWELAEAIAQNVVIVPGSVDGVRAVGDGEALMAVTNEVSGYKYVDDDTVFAQYPTDGLLTSVGEMFLVKDRPNPDGGTAFLEWMLQADTQEWLAQEYRGMRPSNVDAEPDDDLPTLSELTFLDFPEEAETDRDGWIERWQEIIANVS